MKSIILTKEHKSKLLEMCKKLFPEYDFTLNKFEQCFVTLGLKSKDLYEEHIHWFEFCITHLIEKLFNSFAEDDEDFYDRYINNGASFYGVGINEMIFVMLNSKKHPIDYLYKEFKKLKK